MIENNELIKLCEEAIECWERGGELPYDGSTYIREIISRFKATVTPNTDGWCHCKEKGRSVAIIQGADWVFRCMQCGYPAEIL